MVILRWGGRGQNAVRKCHILKELKASLENSGKLKRAKRMTPEEDAEYLCKASIDKNGFKLKYISDFKEVNDRADCEVYGEAYDAANMEVCQEEKRMVQSEFNGRPDCEVYGEACDAANMEVCQEEKRKTAQSVKWSSDDSKTVNRYFEETIISDARNNKSSLPSKGCIMGFLKKNHLPSLAGKDINEQYKKDRTKRFDDRKTLRRKAEKTFRL